MSQSLDLENLFQILTELAMRPKPKTVLVPVELLHLVYHYEACNSDEEFLEMLEIDYKVK